MTPEGVLLNITTIKIMKFLKSLPENSAFFQAYAKLAAPIRSAGFFAQVVSAATEFSILYALSYQSIAPVLPELAWYFAGAVAVLGVVVIEGGLRVAMPQAVDAILYGRFGGLHLVMTMAVFVVVILLGGASGWLSFTNSTAIVDSMTAGKFEAQRQEADSTFRAATAELRTHWVADSTAIASKHATLIASATAAGNAREKAAQTEITNLRRREARTGQSFATRKDAAKAHLVIVQAENTVALATMHAAREKELGGARQSFKSKMDGAESTRAGAIAAIETDQANTIAQYGGGLGWFTVICLVVFFASVILGRVHLKGSAIAETVELSQYDINPHWFTNLRAALWERWNYTVQSRVTAFADRTPAPPLPARPAELYNPAALSNLVITLRIGQGAGEGERVVEVMPKRRQIGFKPDAAFITHEKPEEGHEAPAPKTAGKTPDLRHLKQRLKEYKKRMGSHQQKALKLERKGLAVPKRTQMAIENNRRWVQHYEQLIREAVG